MRTDKPERGSLPWVWVDLDDTLWDFRGNSLHALRDLYRQFDLSRYWPDAETWIDVYHRCNDGLWRLYAAGDVTREWLRMERFRGPLTDAGSSDADARRLSMTMDVVYLDMLGRMSGTVDGAHSLLERLRPHYNIGVLSNGFREVQYNKMRSADLERYMDCIVLSDEIEVNKPNREIYDYACRKAGTTAERSLLIGDNPETDIVGAVRAGWGAIWFNPTGMPVPQILVDVLAEMSGIHGENNSVENIVDRLPMVHHLDQITTEDGTKGRLLGLNIKKST